MPQPWILRTPERGERFRPAGSPGSKRISRLWGDRKVPRSHRADLPLLEAAGVIVWVAGVRVVDGANEGQSEDGFLISLEGPVS